MCKQKKVARGVPEKNPGAPENMASLGVERMPASGTPVSCPRAPTRVSSCAGNKNKRYAERGGGGLVGWLGR